MSDELRANFLRYPQGAIIQAELRQPASRFSVTTLFGPSGCSKTTVLRTLVGLTRPKEGMNHFRREVWLDAGRGVFRLPQERNVAYLFQDDALFPQRTVAEKIGFGL